MVHELKARRSITQALLYLVGGKAGEDGKSVQGGYAHSHGLGWAALKFIDLHTHTHTQAIKFSKLLCEHLRCAM